MNKSWNQEKDTRLDIQLQCGWNVPSVVVGCRILNYHRVQWHLELWVLPTTNARGEERERKRGAMANRNFGA